MNNDIIKATLERLEDEEKISIESISNNIINDPKTPFEIISNKILKTFDKVFKELS